MDIYIYIFFIYIYIYIYICLDRVLRPGDSEVFKAGRKGWVGGCAGGSGLHSELPHCKTHSFKTNIIQIEYK